MKATRLAIPDVILLEPTIHEDERGYFFESYNKRVFEEIVGHPVEFVQDNQSYSKRGVLRGLHYQVPPLEQGKLVRVTHGKVFDVAVDIRKESPTFGKWVGEYLSGDNKRQIWIPPGFAHGFLVVSESAILQYKCSNFYSRDHERIVLWCDPNLSINWPVSDIEMVILSDKDKSAPFLNK